MWDKSKTFGFLKKIGGTPKNEATPPEVNPLVEALGGSGNIEKIELVAGTRLRVSFKQLSQINEVGLTECGVLALAHINESCIHLLMGSSAPEQYKYFRITKEKKL